MFLLYNIANIGVKKVATQDVNPGLPPFDIETVCWLAPVQHRGVNRIVFANCTKIDCRTAGNKQE